MKRIITVCIFFFFAWMNQSIATVVYVTPAGGGLQNGSSWSNAFSGTDLKGQLDLAVPGTEFWVAAGTYYPGVSGDNSAAFFLSDSVSVYGGFNGTETLLSQRNPAVNVTTLSGDLDQSNSLNDNDAYRVVRCLEVVATVTMDGLTIRGAYGGPGILLRNSVVVVNNCRIVDNYGWNNSGGGILAYNSTQLTITRCFLGGNHADGPGAGLYFWEASGTVTNCIFNGNSASDYGTALVAQGTAVVTVRNSTFTNNEGYAMIGDWTWSGTLSIRNSIIWNNGGYAFDGYTDIEYSDIPDAQYYGAGCIEMDPLFANAQLELSPCSPAVNAGNNTDAPANDFKGNARPFGGTVDMGAYELQVPATDSLHPAIVISSTATTVCPAINVTFNASVTNEGPAPVYQWHVNNTNMGTNSNSFTTNALLNGDKVSCTLTNGIACSTPPSVTSDSITMTVNSFPFTVSSSLNAHCVGLTNVLTVSNTAVSYSWTPSTGLNATNTFSVEATPSVGTTYIVTGLGSNGCYMTAVVIDSVVAPITAQLEASGPTTFCPGTPFTLSLISNSGTGLQLNGVNQYFITPNVKPSFASTSATIELWFKANAAGVIVDELGQTSLNNAWHDSQMEILANGHVKVRVWQLTPIDIGTVTFGTWHHAVVRYDAGTSTVDGFLDGIQSAASSTGARATPFDQYWAFGAFDSQQMGSGGGYFNGEIDEVRIWSVARSNNDIIQNYNRHVPANSANLVAYYKLDASSGTIAVDETPNGYTGTLVNSPAWVPSAALFAQDNDEYLWSNGATTQSITVTTSGNYKITATRTGCASTASDSMTVTVIGATITPSGSVALCAGQAPFALTAGVGSVYSWSTGDTTSTIMVDTTAGGVYSVTVDGCVSSPVNTYKVNVSPSSSQLCGDLQLVAAGPTVTDPNYTYSWSTGATTKSITPASPGTYSVSIDGCSDVSSTITPLPGNPSEFGNNVWNVYAWNKGGGADFGTSWNTNYYGYYIADSLNFNTQSYWNATGSPSDAPGYQGCTVAVDEHSWSAKRKGFPCGFYQLDVPDHDEMAQLFINNVKVWEHSGWGDSHTNVWTGFLGAADSVEFRATEGLGVSLGKLEFNTGQVVINGAIEFCAGQSVELSVNVPSSASYSWSTGATTTAITVTDGGTYSVTLSNGTCSANQSKIITKNTLPMMSITGNTTICAGSVTTLSSSGATNVVWTSAPGVFTEVPLDHVAGATLALALRKLKSAYTGPCLRLRRGSDNAESDFGFDGNNLDAQAITTWLNGSTGYCTKLYDQSGNGGDAVAGFNGGPVLQLNGMNGRPVLHYNSTIPSTLVNHVTYSIPYTAIYGARQTGGQRARVLSSTTNNWLLGFWGGGKGQAHFNGWVNATPGQPPADNNFYVYAGAGNGSTSWLYENSNLLASNSGGLSAPDGISLNGSGVFGERSDVDIADVILFSSVLSNTDRVLVESSINDYYGAPVIHANISVSPTTTSQYTVVGTNSFGCSSSATTTVFVNSVTTPAVTVVNTCGSSDLTASNYTGSLLWSNNATTASINVTTAGTYSVTHTATNGCVKTSAVVTATPVVCSAFSLKLFIQGYYRNIGSSTPMDNLGAGGCLKVTGVSVNSTDVDSITVHLMNSSSPFAEVTTVKGILQTDGSLSVNIPVIYSGNYYLKVTHRNSVETWSAITVSPTTISSYDFSNAANKAYGNNQAEVEPGVWAIYSGDISNTITSGSQDGVIESSDFSDEENALYLNLTGYVVSDLTGDGKVDTDDYNLIKGNTFHTIISVHP